MHKARDQCLARYFYILLFLLEKEIDYQKK